MSCWWRSHCILLTWFLDLHKDVTREVVEGFCVPSYHFAFLPEKDYLELDFDLTRTAAQTYQILMEISKVFLYLQLIWCWFQFYIRFYLWYIPLFKRYKNTFAVARGSVHYDTVPLNLYGSHKNLFSKENLEQVFKGNQTNEYTLLHCTVLCVHDKYIYP